MHTLYNNLLHDLALIGVPMDFSLVLKNYSKTYCGRYDPNTSTIILYIYEDSLCTRLVPYCGLLRTAIHEAVHHYQWRHDINFKRVKGVMHNADFYELERHWIDKASHLNLFNKEVYNEKDFKSSRSCFTKCVEYTY